MINIETGKAQTLYTLGTKLFRKGYRAKNYLLHFDSFDECIKCHIGLIDLYYNGDCHYINRMCNLISEMNEKDKRAGTKRRESCLISQQKLSIIPSETTISYMRIIIDTCEIDANGMKIGVALDLLSRLCVVHGQGILQDANKEKSIHYSKIYNLLRNEIKSYKKNNLHLRTPSKQSRCNK